ncbi:MAG: carboxypeptidase regulatory-like domain-containing protein [Candidatus Acidiferrales bacterium]|jgi:streptogramin lyase
MIRNAMETTRQKCSTAIFVIAAILLCFGIPSFAQQPVRGTINGTVTADQGKVIGLRVAAHNLDNHLWYTVFTYKGHYTVPQALPGRYEIKVYEPAFASPNVSVQLGPGETKTADISIAQKADPTPSMTTGTMGAVKDRGASTKKIVYFNSMDEVYPPGPGRDMVRAACTGCHGDNLTGYHYTKEKFLDSVRRMTEEGTPSFPNVQALGRTPLSDKQKEQMADYLATNFGPGTPDRGIRVDPLTVDEEVASKAIYVSYDLPPDAKNVTTAGTLPDSPMVDGVFEMLPGLKQGTLQAATISPVDGSIWYSSRGSNSILGLYPKELDPAKRWRNYPIKGDPFVAASGMASDREGRIYWSELRGGMLGELDPATGKQIRHVIPQKGVGVGLIVDKDDNVDFTLIWGAMFGRLDAKTRTIHTYPTPTPDNGVYGLAVDAQGNMWSAGWQKGTINKWDSETGTVIEYPVPESWGQMRRIGVDSKGVVWSSAHHTGILVKLDPATGKLTDFKVPLSGVNPYESWPDKQDNIWTADQTHSILIKLDPKTSKWTFYPMPQPRQSVPKMEVDADNTLWFGTRGLDLTVAVHFYPNGYSASQPPIP